MEITQRAWRVFYTTPRAEKQCEVRLEMQGVAPFLPKVTVTRQWKDRRKKVIEPLFRSYIFAHVDEFERLQALSTPGIVQTVTFGGQPAEVSEEEIKQLRLVQQAQRRPEIATLRLPGIGMPVQVTGGPLQGLRGIILEHRQRTDVLVQIRSIQQALKVQVLGSVVEVLD